MRVAVAGGTGLVGSMTVAALQRTGHEPVVLARSRGVDVTTGAGLDAALAGVGAVVDVTNVATVSRRASTGFFAAATGRLLEAGRRAGVHHHVALSIVGVDRVENGYYAGKALQEQLVRRADVPGTVVRATQFHEFAGQVLARSPGPLALVPRMRVQPVAAAEVAVRLAAVATGPPSPEPLELAGPDVHDLVALARRVARRSGSPRRVLGVRPPGRAWRLMAHGALLPQGPVWLGSQSFDEWLDLTLPGPARPGQGDGFS